MIVVKVAKCHFTFYILYLLIYPTFSKQEFVQAMNIIVPSYNSGLAVMLPLLVSFVSLFLSRGDRNNHVQETANANTYESLRRCHIFGQIAGLPDVEYILDIGAYDGQWSDDLIKTGYFPNAKYFLVEGNDVLKDEITERGFNDYVISLVCDIDDKKVPYHSINNCYSGPFSCTGNSIYRERTVAFDEENSFVQQRSCYSVDTLLEVAGKGTLQFGIIKMDVQGSEYDVLVGAKNTIANSNALIMIEVSILPLNGPTSATFGDISIIMELYGYTLVDIAHTSRAQLDQSPINLILQMDTVWMRKEFVQAFDTVWDNSVKWQSSRISS